jgi:hypothetical protein
LGGHNSNAIDMSKELMTAYRKDPETYKRNAKVFETYYWMLGAIRSV